jgi:hypothetical protein
VSCQHLALDLAHLYDKSIIMGKPLDGLPSIFCRHNRNEEPSQWLYKYNNSFVAHNTKEEEQMHLAAFLLQGDTLTWFIRWEQEIGHLNWLQFSAANDRRFSPPLHHNHLGDLTNTCQLGESDNYTNQFLLTLTKVTGLSTT